MCVQNLMLCTIKVVFILFYLDIIIFRQLDIEEFFNRIAVLCWVSVIFRNKDMKIVA